MPYDAGNLHAVMAGKGDPYAALSPLRMRLLRALRDVHAEAELCAVFNLSVEQLKAEVAPLAAASLAVARDGEWQPACLIVDAAETEHVLEHARAVGDALAEALAQQWDALERDYRQMSLVARFTLADMGFMLVGDQILDVGLLDACAREGSLMPPAPPRPSPNAPDARYYFWLIEGAAEQVGRYGQRTTTLGVDGWQLLTFGEYQIDGIANRAREAIEGAARSLLASDAGLNAEALAQRLGIAASARDDARRWKRMAATYADTLAAIYKQQEKSLRRLYEALQGSPYSVFGEFFCWYDHVAYAFAIDRLAADGLIHIPAERFQAVLWQDDGRGDF